MLAIFKKEMRTYFTTPIGYIFIAVFLALEGLNFCMTTLWLQSSDMSYFFTISLFLFVILIPILTMKSFSEEKRTKTEQLLLTAPINLYAMVGAKYLAALTLFAGTALLSDTMFLLLPIYGTAHPSILCGNIIALLLVGAAFIAIGLFISSLTENQFTAVIASIAVLLVLLVLNVVNNYIDVYFIRSIISWFSIFSRYQNFTYGIFDFAAIFYYLSIAVVFLFLTVRVYERRRWN